MTITMCLDYIEEYVEMNNPKKHKQSVKRSTQADFGAF
ncbi:hypothetical protein ATH33_0844 [Thermoactinomyces vulgaris]|nr:hypothetical protein ATH33_0844 [Thermoactinomyces vulgaris]